LLQPGITPFKTFIQESCAALISSGLNMGMCDEVLVPQVGSGRNVLRGGGGGFAAWSP
jgi:hypothetical protein